jgi:hypothetical protein
MNQRQISSTPVTLNLQDSAGGPWPLRLSADCLRFIGPYRRVEGFNIDAMLLFEGVRRAG